MRACVRQLRVHADGGRGGTVIAASPVHGEAPALEVGESEVGGGGEVKGGGAVQAAAGGPPHLPPRPQAGHHEVRRLNATIRANITSLIRSLSGEPGSAVSNLVIMLPWTVLARLDLEAITTRLTENSVVRGTRLQGFGLPVDPCRIDLSSARKLSTHCTSSASW